MEGGEPSQHTVMLGATRLQVLSNGRDNQGAAPVLDVNAILAGSGSNHSASTEAKVPETPSSKSKPKSTEMETEEADHDDDVVDMAEDIVPVVPSKSKRKKNTSESGSKVKKSRIVYD